MSVLRRLEDVPLWAPLASILLAVTWMLPNASLPWMGFHKDLFCGTTFLLVAITLALRNWRSGRAFRADPVACVLGLLALWSLGQWAVGIQYFFGHAATGAMYLLGAAMAIVAGRAWEAEEEQAAARWMFPAFFMAAIANTGLMLKQWLDVDGFDIYTYPLASHGRPFGNLFQPNQAATLVLLGLVSLFWMHWRRAVGAAGVLLAGGFLVFGLALTQSRAGALSFALLVAAGAWLGPRILAPGARRLLFVLLAWFTVAAVLVPNVNASLGLQGDMLAGRTDGGRLTAWRVFLLAAWKDPLTGIGFLPGVLPQVIGSAAGYSLGGYFSWAHNALLDVAVWFGLPAAIALVAAGIYQLARLVRARLAPVPAFYMAALIAPLLHGMLELPLAYAYFLLPCGFLVGALGATVSMPAVRIDARAVTAVAVILGASLFVVAVDYLRVERSIYAWRFKTQNVGRHHELDLPETLLLNEFRAYMIGVRMPAEALDADMALDFRQAVHLQPSPAAMQKLVARLVHEGDLEGARHWIEVARSTTEAGQRRILSLAWQEIAAADRKYAQVEWPE